MRRAYTLRAYPTRSQEGRAVRLLRDHCDLYNAALQERREAWRMQRASITYVDQSAQLKEIRAADPDGQGRHSFTAQQQTLRRLNTVFIAFFKRARATKRRQTRQKPGFPRFKPYQRFDQVLFVAGDGAKWEPVGTGRWAHASFQAVGRVKVHQHRQVVGRVKTLQLKREGRRWYVIVVSEAHPQRLPATGRPVGIDLGVARFLTTSDGHAGWAQFTQILVAKAASAGRRTILVNPQWTSVTCHMCGARCTRPRQDTVICPSCGEWDADLNGARNIATRAGLGSGQAFAA
jgi:putative transposase